MTASDGPLILQENVGTTLKAGNQEAVDRLDWRGLLLMTNEIVCFWKLFIKKLFLWPNCRLHALTP
jgi:hypothetical protein